MDFPPHSAAIRCRRFFCSLIPPRSGMHSGQGRRRLRCRSTGKSIVAAGGPDGGDGGRGGDIIFVADDNLSTLMDFRYKRKYTAPERREWPRQARCSGADGDGPGHPRAPRHCWCSDAPRRTLSWRTCPAPSRWWWPSGGRGGWGNSALCHARPARSPSLPSPACPGEEYGGASLELKLHCGRGPGGLSRTWARSTLIIIMSSARAQAQDRQLPLYARLPRCWASCASGRKHSFVCCRHPGPDRRRGGRRRPGPRFPAPC